VGKCIDGPVPRKDQRLSERVTGLCCHLDTAM